MMKRLILLAPFAALAIACGGSSADPTPTRERAARTPTPAAVTVDGTFTLVYKREYFNSQDDPEKGAACKGTGGYSDVRAGMQVRLLDGSEVLDVDSFGEGRISAATKPEFQFDPSITEWTIECTFKFQLKVPDGHEFYTVEIGRRGERTYSYREIIRPGQLAFALGQ